MTGLTRSDILARLNSKIAKGIPIIGGGAGTGLSAKAVAGRAHGLWERQRYRRRDGA